MVKKASSARYVAVGAHRPWIPGFWRRFPWLGLGSLLGALICACGAGVVLKESDSRPISEWSVLGHSTQPTVLLAILAAIANALLRFALTEGLAIAWWVKAVKGGSIGDFHRTWAFGQSFWAIITSPLHFDYVGLAGLLMTFIIIDGPLLQRASSVTTVSHSVWENFTLQISPSPFVSGATGLITNHGSAPDFYSTVFQKVVEQYSNKADIVLNSSTCNGICEVTVVAAGLDHKCTQSILETHLPHYGQASANASQLNRTMFSVDVDYTYGTRPNSGFNVYALFKSEPGYDAGLVNHTCVFQEALVRYPLRITNKTVTLLSSTSKNSTAQIIMRNPESGGFGVWPMTTGGISMALYDQYESNTTVNVAGPYYSVFNSGSAGRQYLSSDIDALLSMNMTWKDPIPDIQAMVRELSFRTAVLTTLDHANDNETEFTQGYLISDYDLDNQTATSLPFLHNQTRNGTETRSVVVYRSHFGYLSGALAIILFSTLSILWTFFGWWMLGRPISLSPIEIAKAFDAPLLQKGSSNATASDVVRTIGSKEAQYGVSISALKGFVSRSPPVIHVSSIDTLNPEARSKISYDHGSLERDLGTIFGIDPQNEQLNKVPGLGDGERDDPSTMEETRGRVRLVMLEPADAIRPMNGELYE